MKRSKEIASAKTPRNDGVDRFLTREQCIEAFRMTVVEGDGVSFLSRFFRKLISYELSRNLTQIGVRVKYL